MLTVMAVAAAPAITTAATLPDIEDEVMCPVCGTTLDISNGPQAERERALIRRLIDEGRSKEEIKDALVAEYGGDILATPDDSGFDLVAWLLPGIGLALAVAAIGFSLARRRRGADPIAAPELPANEREMLDRDLSRYDL